MIHTVPLVSGQVYRNLETDSLVVATEVRWGKTSFTLNVSVEQLWENLAVD